MPVSSALSAGTGAPGFEFCRPIQSLELAVGKKWVTKLMITPTKDHPFSDEANLFPEASPEEYQAILASIKEIGQQEPIGVKDGRIFDDRNRYRACRELGIEPIFTELGDDVDPLQYVLAKNLARRHLDPSQRAVIAYKLSAWSKPGGDRRSDAYREGLDHSANLPDRFTQAQSAELMAVSPRSVRQAGKVISEDSTAVPALRHAVEAAGERRVNVSDAAKVVDQPAEVQEQALARVLSGASKTIFGAVRQIQSEVTEASEAEALESHRAKPIDETVTLHLSAVSDLSRLVEPGRVDAIITNPPSDPQSLTMFSDLAEFAAHSLKPDGVIVVINNTMQLPQVLEGLKHPDLKWVMEIDLQHPEAPFDVGKPRRITLRRLSLLIYGKPEFKLNAVDNVMALQTSDELPLAQLQRCLFDEAMALIVEHFARPGQVVCDPILKGRAGAALAARKHGCYFIGADNDEVNLDRVRKGLTLDEGDVGSDSNSRVTAPGGLIPPISRTEDSPDDA